MKEICKKDFKQVIVVKYELGFFHQNGKNGINTRFTVDIHIVSPTRLSFF
jgi:hypothetical protein